MEIESLLALRCHVLGCLLHLQVLSLQVAHTLGDDILQLPRRLLGKLDLPQLSHLLQQLLVRGPQALLTVAKQRVLRLELHSLPGDGPKLIYAGLMTHTSP